MKEKIITLHQANNLDILIQTLSILIKNNKTNNNLLLENIVITSSNTIKNYIDKKLSEILGVSFNIKYQNINSFIWNILHYFNDNIPNNNPYNTENIKWILINLFYSKEYSKILPQKIVNLFNNIFNNDINIYDFSANLAVLYDQYITFRPNMISKWSKNQLTYTNDENEKWQMIIWNYLVNKISQPNRYDLFKMLDNIIQSNKKLKYQQIFIFGQTSLATTYINALDKISTIINIHFLLFNPSHEYWTNYNTKNIQEQNLNPLLTSLSKQYRDFFDEINNLNFYTSKFLPSISNDNTLLNIIKNDIKNFNYPKNISFEKIDDNSLNIISAYSEIRELQILKDYILNYLNNNNNKNPENIIVSSPNIEKYIPFIDAIFGENAIDKIPIEYNILNTKISYKQELLQTIEQIFNLINSKFEVSSIIPIIENKLILKKFNLNYENINLIKEIINELNIHWGWNEQDRINIDKKEDFFTFNQGIQRSILGMFLIEEEKFKLWFDKAPYYFELHFNDILYNVITLLNTLGNVYNHFKNKYNITDWIDNIKSLINDLIFDDTENQNVKIQFEQELNELNINVNFAQFDYEVPFNIIYHIILKFLNKPKDVSTKAGGITFCNLSALRSIPYSFIALLGLNDMSFPREKFKLPFDLIEQYPQKGDSCRKDDDKYLFLETILSAKDTLYLSYIGKNIQNGKDLAPSSLINEIIETISIMTNSNFEELFNKIIKQYPLQNFSKKYYYDNNIFTYNNKFFNYDNNKNNKKEINFICNDYKYQDFDKNEYIPLVNLIKFWKNPSQYWLLNNYHWKQEYIKDISNQDNEPVDFDVYKKYNSIYLKSIIDNTDYNKVNNFLKKQSKIPVGYTDEYFVKEIEKINNRLKEKQKEIYYNIINSSKITSKELNINFDIKINNFDIKINLNHQFKNIHEIGQIEICNKTITKESKYIYIKIEFYLKHLFYCCYENKDTYIISTEKIITIKNIAKEIAKQELAKWIKYYLIGIKNPLPFLPKISFDTAEKIKNQENYSCSKNSDLYLKILNKLNEKNDYSISESDSLEYKLIWGNNCPLDDELFWDLSKELLLPLINTYEIS